MNLVASCQFDAQTELSHSVLRSEREPLSGDDARHSGHGRVLLEQHPADGFGRLVIAPHIRLHLSTNLDMRTFGKGGQSANPALNPNRKIYKNSM